MSRKSTRETVLAHKQQFPSESLRIPALLQAGGAVDYGRTFATLADGQQSTNRTHYE